MYRVETKVLGKVFFISKIIQLGEKSDIQCFIVVKLYLTQETLAKASRKRGKQCINTLNRKRNFHKENGITGSSPLGTMRCAVNPIEGSAHLEENIVRMSPQTTGQATSLSSVLFGREGRKYANVSWVRKVYKIQIHYKICYFGYIQTLFLLSE